MLCALELVLLIRLSLQGNESNKVRLQFFCIIVCLFIFFFVCFFAFVFWTVCFCEQLNDSITKTVENVQIAKWFAQLRKGHSG